MALGNRLLLESGDLLLLESEAENRLLLELDNRLLPIREKPPLRLHVDAVTPTGKHFRWGGDEPDPANVPSGISFSDTMPGGFENGEMRLPRQPRLDYSDLERLTTLRVLGP